MHIASAAASAAQLSATLLPSDYRAVAVYRDGRAIIIGDPCRAPRRNGAGPILTLLRPTPAAEIARRVFEALNNR